MKRRLQLKGSLMDISADSTMRTLLTEREQDILRFLAQGLSDNEIAERLVLTVGTVKWYNRQIYSKLGVRNRTEAVTQAQQLGLLQTPGSPLTTIPNTSALQYQLPAQVTSFVGRTHEIQKLRILLLQSRLVTLTGSPGTGKTRLAIEVASQLADTFPDGIYFISLAALRQPELVIHSIAQALQVKETEREPLIALLQNSLRDKKILLILDNFEHLLAAASYIADLLAVASQLTILVTSREVLHLYGEHEFSVPPLQLPDLKKLLSFDDLQRQEAVELFIQRAKAADPDFMLDERNASAVATTCVHLDGLPLAIELAAARIKFYAPQTLLIHLGSRLEALREGPRDLPARQRTLRSTLAWSYDLLDKGEQLLFARLSVFVGGCTAHDAEIVCGKDLHLDVAATIESLVSKSLLKQAPSLHDELRFVMLETMREYALEKLQAHGESAFISEQHAHHFLAKTEQLAQTYYGLDEPYTLNWLEVQHDNIRAALEWSLVNDTTGQTSLELIANLARFWELKGHLNEGRSWLQRTLDLPSAKQPTKAYADALQGIGDLAYLQSDYTATHNLYMEALTIYRVLEDGQGAAHALLGLGEVATEVGDYDTAPKLFEEAYTIMRRFDDKRGCARALTQLGWGALRIGDLQQAHEQLLEGLALYQAINDKVGIGLTYSGLGEIAVRSGDYETAVNFLENSLRLRKELGQKWGIAVSLGSLAWVSLRKRDLNRATQLLHESLLIRHEIEDKGGIAWCLEKLTDIAQLEGNTTRAVCIFAAATAIRTSVNSVIDPADQPHYHNLVQQLKTAMGDEAFNAVWTKGASMSLEEVIGYVSINS